MSNTLNILVADERASAQETATLIQRWGHRVEQAYDGLQAVDEARLVKPDLMLVDLSLPGLNGFGVAQQIRRFPELQAVKLVALVKSSADQTARGLRKAGFRDSLLKPVVPLELLATIVKTRDALARSTYATQTARHFAALSRDRVGLARQGLAESRSMIAVSQQTLSRPLPSVADSPPANTLCALLKMLLERHCLDHEQAVVASKVLVHGEDCLSPAENSVYARLRQRYLKPACTLCRYRIPHDEVVDSWSNGGYCALCSEVMR